MNLISNTFRGVGAITYGATVYNLADGGLAKTLVLETLRHGTNLVNNLKIRIFGGTPSKHGYTPNFKYDNTTGYFYIFKDSELSLNGIPKKKASLIESFIYSTALACLVKAHARISSGMQAYYFLGYPKITDSTHIPGKIQAISMIGMILSPTLRFRFSHIDPKRMEEDENYFGEAYKTAQTIEPWRIGPLGSCLTGFNTDWFARVKNDPSKALTGVAQLVAAGILFKIGGSRFKGKLPYVIAGALLA